MDTGALYDTLRQLQTWRNQIAGLGLLPPDVTALIKLMDELPGERARLDERKAALDAREAALSRREAELDRQLAAKERRNAELDAMLAEKEPRNRKLDEDYEAFKAKFRTPAAV